MENRNEKRNEEVEEEGQPGNLSSFNPQEENKNGSVEQVKGQGKDESEGYMDYNGNSEQNAPVKE